MANNVHDKIIKKAAKEILVPLGLFQKGQSRCWLDDNGWYMVQVEFQPSAWSKGAYLNVGISFLWEKSEALNETLPFDIGYRELRHVEFRGGEESFYKEMIEMAIQAKEKVLYYRKFNNFNYCRQQLEDIAKSRDSLWSNWDMAMFCFLTKDNVNGKNYLKKIVEANTQEKSCIEWVDKLLAKSKELYIKEADLNQYVVNSIIQKRSYFSSKSSFKKLKNWQDLSFN